MILKQNSRKLQYLETDKDDDITEEEVDFKVNTAKRRRLDEEDQTTGEDFETSSSPSVLSSWELLYIEYVDAGDLSELEKVDLMAIYTHRSKSFSHTSEDLIINDDNDTLPPPRIFISWGLHSQDADDTPEKVIKKENIL